MRHGVLFVVFAVLALSGCRSAPDTAQIQEDLRQLAPGCRVLDRRTGEGDSETVYVILDLQCDSAPASRHLEIGYLWVGGGWRRFHPTPNGGNIEHRASDATGRT